MQLKSRSYTDPVRFVEDFLGTLTPGVIPRTDFIQWNNIQRKTEKLIPFVEFYSDFKNRILLERNIENELADSLLACDNPLPYIQCAFEILGHTDTEVVTKQDDIDLTLIARAIEQGDQESALYIAHLLIDLGFEKILIRNDLENILFGVQIGLETHRRKNIGGEHFTAEVREILQKITNKLFLELSKKIELLEGTRLVYSGGLSKKVDFTIKIDDKYRFGIEANFYTVPGSKPTEIKRSYGNIREGLLNIGTDLIWITDGKGYRKMRRSLGDAFVIFPNIYNLYQAKKFLADDFIDLLRK